MKLPTLMTNGQILHWLNKTDYSISTYKSLGGEMKYERGLTLLDRYGDLMDEARERNWKGVNLWKTYCDSNGSCYSHNQYDLFA